MGYLRRLVLVRTALGRRRGNSLTGLAPHRYARRRAACMRAGGAAWPTAPRRGLAVPRAQTTVPRAGLRVRRTARHAADTTVVPSCAGGLALHV